MKKYVRTNDGKMFDLEKIKKNIKKKSMYPHLHNWKLEPTDDARGSLRLSWMADFKGSKSKPEKVISPRECAIILDCDSSECKQADFIEELCDDLIVKYQNSLPISQRISDLKKCMELNHIIWKEHFGWLFESFKKKLEWVKLGIYTDKGLIYVAKMNSEGDLELL